MDMKELILKLRKQGKSYREIQKEVKCSRSLISYYLNPQGKTKWIARQTKNRFRKKAEYKMNAGGKCSLCGYDKCLDALQFHHTDPKSKKFEITHAIWYDKSHEEIIEEMKKCILVCANCHAEIHAVR